MLATILKSPVATSTTIAIIEAYANLHNLKRNILAAAEEPSKAKRRSILSKTGETLSSIINDDLRITEEELSLELNLMAIKIKGKIKKTHK